MSEFLSPAIKLSIADLALAGVTREFPHKLDHVLFSPSDAQSPRALHPALYGCYDWHSAVHSHWVLVVLLDDPAVAERRPAMLEVLGAHFSGPALSAELEYVLQPGRQGFERPYGWAWLWALQDAVQALAPATHDAALWATRLAPLGRELMQRWQAWLERQTYPCRQGTHANTAFALGLALDHAAAAKDSLLATTLKGHALRLFANDEGFSLAGEPSANDFLSPALTEAALMSRCLEPAAWQEWWRRFIPRAQGAALLSPARVSDRGDAQGVHLDGLNLSRAWHAADIARFLGEAPDAQAWQQLATAHWQAGIAHVRTGDFLGEHWLGTFALAAGRALSASSVE